MRVILLKDIPNLGKKDDIKSVSDGYGRNFLIRNKLAEILTPQIAKKLEVKKENQEKISAGLKEKVLLLKEKIEKMKLIIKSKVGESSRIFGSITPAKIISELAKHGINLEKDQILSQPVKTLGEHKIKIKLPQGTGAELDILIEAEKK
jgi:large subunit ribosomal protein L9